MRCATTHRLIFFAVQILSADKCATVDVARHLVGECLAHVVNSTTDGNVIGAALVSG